MNTADERARALDAADPLASFRKRFHIPDGIIYLDGNSLGAMPCAAPTRLAQVAKQEWANGLIRSWDGADWIRLPLTVGDRIAPLVGVGQGEIAVGDSTSVNLFKCLAAALRLRPGRRVILAERDNFPTDNYIVEGLASLLGDVKVRFFGSEDPIEPYLDSSVGVVVLSHVHYRTSRVHDMSAVNRAAHAAGVLTLWDLSHSTGALKVALAEADADFAVGCTYKYLNGGPGAPAFAWVAPRLVEDVHQPLSGWMGHNNPFAFTFEYEPGSAIKRMVCGTPQILSLSTLDECLKLWSEVDLGHLFEKSTLMTNFFLELVETECSGYGLDLLSPRDVSRRGSHISYGLDIGYPVMRALAERGVVGDFRAPNTMRFGFAPLYLSFSDIARAVSLLRRVLEEGLWDIEAYKIRAAVT
jgi:kynureninase